MSFAPAHGSAHGVGYETAANPRGGALEYGAPAGGIRMLDGRDHLGRQQHSPQPQRNEDGGGQNFLVGIGTNYWKVHAYKGRMEAFAPGCFDKSIANADKIGIGLLINHDFNKVVKFGIELFSDAKSLIFRAAIPLSEIGRVAWKAVESGETTDCSVGYLVDREETKIVDGASIRIIREADLVEISIGMDGLVGLVPGTRVMPAKSAHVPLRTLAESLESEFAALKFTRALRNFGSRMFK